MMPTIQEIEAAVTQLTSEQLAAFRTWFLEFEAQRGEQPAEGTAWQQLAAQGLAAAYGDDEPEYSLNDVKKPNPAYDGR